MEYVHFAATFRKMLSLICVGVLVEVTIALDVQLVNA